MKKKKQNKITGKIEVEALQWNGIHNCSTLNVYEDNTMQCPECGEFFGFTRSHENEQIQNNSQ